MKRLTACLIGIFCSFSIQSWAQTVVVTDDNSITTGHPSSVLDVISTSKGFLAPRMTESQRSAISSPATGLLVYQTDNISGYYYYDGSVWLTIAKGVGWTASGSNVYYNTGKVGIGNSSPGEALDVTGNLKFSGALISGSDAGTASYLLISGGANTAPQWTNPGTYFEPYTWKLEGNNVPALKKFGTTSNYDIPFITNNIEKMRLTSGGYLGLGVDSPAALLHVGRSNPTSGITPVAIFEETRDAGLSNSVVMQLVNKSLTSNATKFLIGSSSSQKRWILGTDKDGNNSQNFYLWDDNSVLPRLYIEGSNGYTGLGTASPSALLHVYSHLPASSDVPAAVFEGESDGGIVSLSLVNKSGARAKTAFIFGGAANAYQWSLGSDIQGNNEHNFYIYDEGSFNTRFFIDQSGNVGIGNIVPTELLDVSGNIKLSGNIVGGTWTGNIVDPTYGGTGVDNGSNTITLSGNLTVEAASNISGNLSVAAGKTLTANNTIILAGPDGGSYTLPASGTLVNTGITTLSALASIGTITTGTWNGTVISPTYGGTGINNGTKTITLGGDLATSGANNLTLTTTGTTNVTLPTTGTLVNTTVTTLSSLSSVGTITAGTWNATTIAADKGGTGQSTYTTGDMLYANSNSTLAKVAGNTTTTAQFLSQTGTGSASAQPAWQTLHTSYVSNIIRGSVTVNNTTGVTPGNPLEIDIPFTGALPNASVIINPRADLSNRLGIGYCYVSAANVIRMVVTCTNGTISLASNTEFDITVINP